MQGKFIHVAPTQPRSDWNCGFELPWWKNPDDYRIGRLTGSTCLIRIMNMLTGAEDFLEVGDFPFVSWESGAVISGNSDRGWQGMLLVHAVVYM